MQLHLHEWGHAEAPAVVCLHGVSAHGRRYRRLAEDRLARRFRVLAPDLRGHGRSGYEPPWSITTQLGDVVETIEATGAEPRVWIGHSYGARLILELCARRGLSQYHGRTRWTVALQRQASKRVNGSRFHGTGHRRHFAGISSPPR